MTTWDDLLDEFRALGGTADNVCLKVGRYGRGLFPKDSSKPVQIRIPDSLLVDHKFAQFPSGDFRLSADAPVGARERTFLENYEGEFSWPAGKREIEMTLQTIQETSPELRDLLRQSYYGHRWVVEPTDELVQQRFLDSRVINYKGADVIMPIIELANHGHETEYQIDEGVGLSGMFSDEILVRYQLCDPLQIFGKWGFASDKEFIGLSVHFKLEQAGVVVERADPKPKSEARPFTPAVSVEGGRINFPYLLLGHRTKPALPRGNFLRMMRDAGRLRTEAEDVFDFILHGNRMHLLKLIGACEGTAPRPGRLLRDMARFQLEAISHCVGRADT